MELKEGKLHCDMCKRWSRRVTPLEEHLVCAGCLQKLMRKLSLRRLDDESAESYA